MPVRFLHTSVLLALGLFLVALTAEAVDNQLKVWSPCIDKHESKSDCIEWAWFGECDKNPEFMHEQCKQSCGLCTPTPEEEGECQDHHSRCTDWAEKGNLQVNNLWYVYIICTQRLQWSVSTF